MTDQKVPGGPPPENYGQPPPPYAPGPPGPPGPQGPPPQGGYPAAYPPQPAPGGYGQPAPGYGPPTTVIVQQPAGATPGSMFRYHTAPALIVCQHCNATVTTSVTYESGLLTWLGVGLLCLFGCWFGCCLIPFCVDACKDAVHTCPNCKQMVGKHRQLS